MQARLLIFITLFILSFYSSKAQVDSVQKTNIVLDQSLIKTTVLDTLKTTMTDTLTPKSLQPLDSLAQAQWLEHFRKSYGFPTFSPKEWLNGFVENNNHIKNHQEGKLLNKGSRGTIIFTLILFVLFAIYKNTNYRKLELIIESYFSNRALAIFNKEENSLTSWSFIFLFILLSLTISLFIYLIIKPPNVSTTSECLKFYLNIFGAILVLFIFKLICTQFLGFFIGLQKVSKQYINTLFVSYFNAAILLIPTIILLIFSNTIDKQHILLISYIILPLIFIIQFARTLLIILPQYKFRKLYLFLYLCAFEICPILILIKTIS